YVKYPILRLSKEDFSVDKKMYKKHLVIGLPMAFQFSITAIGTVVLQGALNMFGPAKIAAFTAASKVEQLVTQAAPSFGVTMANYSGQNLGADKIDRIKDGVRKCTFLTLSFAVLAGVIIYAFGEPLVNLFLDEKDPEVIDAALVYLHTMIWFFPALFMIFVYRNMLQGVGKSFMPLMAGVFELISRTVVALVLPGIIGYMGICLAGPIAWVAAAVPLGITYFYEIRKMMFEWNKRHTLSF
nr:MATE family efflux transporter [Lachnospiraceae bacterium]